MNLGNLVKHNYSDVIYLGKNQVPWREGEIGMILEIDKFGPGRVSDGPFITVLIQCGIGIISLHEVERI